MSEADAADRRKAPGLWLYWLAGLLWLGVPVGLTALAVPQVLKLVNSLQEQGMQLQAPGETELHFQNAGDFALFAAGEDAGATTGPRGGSLMLRQGLVLLLEDEEGRTVSLQPPSGRTTVSMGGQTWIRVAVFHIPAPGRYRFTAEYGRDSFAHGRAGLLVASGDWPFAQILEGLMLLLPMFFTALASIVLGVGLGVYVYVRRYDAKLARGAA